MTKHAQCRLQTHEREEWLKLKRELARLIRGLDDLADLRRKYGEHRHFDQTEKFSQGKIRKAEGDLAFFVKLMEEKYPRDGERKAAS
jgi:hypothetical protein